MNIPKPSPPKQKLHVDPPVEVVKKKVDIPTVTEKPKVTEKKPPFVLQPHLTVHPFRDNEKMRDLEKALKKVKAPVHKNVNRKPVTKTQEKK